jgi:hypothetical protein
MRYRLLGGDWITRRWYMFEPKESSYLATDGHRLRTNNNIFYYHAEIPGTNYKWEGEEVRDGLRMRKGTFSVKENRYEFRMSCTNAE